MAARHSNGPGRLRQTCLPRLPSVSISSPFDEFDTNLMQKERSILLFSISGLRQGKDMPSVEERLEDLLGFQALAAECGKIDLVWQRGCESPCQASPADGMHNPTDPIRPGPAQSVRIQHERPQMPRTPEQELVLAAPPSLH